MSKRKTREVIRTVCMDRDGTTGETGRFVRSAEPDVEWASPTNASIACIDSGRVLLVQRSLAELSFAGFWEFPGGSIEAGETPSEAAVREFREECGADVILDGQVAAFSWVSGGRSKIEAVFAGRPKGSITIGHDHCGYAWVGLDDLAGNRFMCSHEVRSIAVGLCSFKG